MIPHKHKYFRKKDLCFKIPSKLICCSSQNNRPEKRIEAEQSINYYLLGEKIHMANEAIPSQRPVQIRIRLQMALLAKEPCEKHHDPLCSPSPFLLPQPVKLTPHSRHSKARRRRRNQDCARAYLHRCKNS